jgi:DNA mismatch endonuclease (patch repair protein)
MVSNCPAIRVECRERQGLFGVGTPSEPVAPERSRLMALVRQRNTGPELIVRKALHALGYRFRLHRRELPGSPDIVLPSRRKAILVHGCFWHRHKGCPRSTTPKTRRGFWKQKFEQNKSRDTRNLIRLRALGWEALIVWECETTDIASLTESLRYFVER